MSITKLSVIDIMAEAVKSEVNTDNEYVNELANDIADVIDNIEEMSVPFRYTPEMVPVIFDEATGRYYVEYDSLHKLAESDAEFGDEIELVTKYGKIEFRPKLDSGMVDTDDEEREPIQEEEPEEDDDDEEKIEESYFEEGGLRDKFIANREKKRKEKERKAKEEKLKKKRAEQKAKHESYYDECGYGNPFHGDFRLYCRDRDALAAVILANMPIDPNKEEMMNKEVEGDEFDTCPTAHFPTMTMENTYVVVDSKRDIYNYLNEVCETAKCGGVALANGKAKLKKADEVFTNLYNQGIKVVRKSVTEGGARAKYIEQLKEKQKKEFKEGRDKDANQTQATAKLISRKNDAYSGKDIKSIKGGTQYANFKKEERLSNDSKEKERWDRGNETDKELKNKFKNDHEGPEGSNIDKKINARAEQKAKHESFEYADADEFLNEAYWASRDVRKQCKQLKKDIETAERFATRGDDKQAKQYYDSAAKQLARLEREADLVDNDSVWDLIVRFLVLNGWVALPVHIVRMIKNGTITELNRKEAQAACARLRNKLEKGELIMSK